MNRVKYLAALFFGTFVYVLLSMTFGQNSLYCYNKMEEQKKGKVVAMKAAKEEGENIQKYSYEELNHICAELSQQNRVLMQRINQMDLTNMFRRLDYLFMVLKYESVFKDATFVGSCVEEIKEALTIKEQGDDEEKEG